MPAKKNDDVQVLISKKIPNANDQIKELLLQFFKNEYYMLSNENGKINYDLIKGDLGFLCQDKYVEIEGLDGSYRTIVIIDEIQSKVEKQIADIPGIYMLSEQQKKEYINQLILMECEIYIKFCRKEDVQKINYKQKDLFLQIDNQITSAADTYSIPIHWSDELQSSEINPGSVSWLPTFFTFDSQTSIDRLINKWTIEFKNIIGIQILSKEQYCEFLKKFILCKERINSNARDVYGCKTSDKQNLRELEDNIYNVIHKKYIEKVHDEYESLQEKMEMNFIADQSLRNMLGSNLLEALAIKEKHNDSVDMEIKKCLLKITIAKYLSNIYFFNKLPLLEQLDKIQELSKTFEDVCSEINGNDQNILEQFRNNMLNMVVGMAAHDTSAYKNALNILGLEHNQNKSLIQQFTTRLSNFFRTPRVVAALQTGVLAVSVVNAAPLLPNISSLMHNHDNKKFNPASIKSNLLAFSLGVVAGYNNSSLINFVFPIDYIIKEISDIYNNHDQKTLTDRTIRSLPILLAATLGVYVVGISANGLFSVPMIAATTVGSFITMPIVAVCLKLANKVSNLWHRGLTNPSFYDFGNNGKIKLGNNEENIKKVSHFFQYYIGLLQGEIEQLQTANQSSKGIEEEINLVVLCDNLKLVKDVFNRLKTGNYGSNFFSDFDKATSYIIAYTQSSYTRELERELCYTEIVDGLTNLLKYYTVKQSPLDDFANSVAQLYSENKKTTCNRLADFKQQNTNIVEKAEYYLRYVVEIYNIIRPSKQELPLLASVPTPLLNSDQNSGINRFLLFSQRNTDNSSSTLDIGRALTGQTDEFLSAASYR